MKWFKHLSTSLKDSVIFEAIEIFGSDAYLVFFGTLELMSDEFDIHNPGTVALSIKKMTTLFQLSRQKTVRILQHFDQTAKITTREKVSFLVSIDATHVVINCHKLAMLCDNHTQKLLRDTSKLLQSENGFTSIQEEEGEEEEDKRIKKPPISPNGGFDLFWKSYPRKESKGAAEKAWLKVKPDKDLLERILLSVEDHKRTEQWSKDNGAFIPYAQKFLNNKYYEDEIKEGEKKLW